MISVILATLRMCGFLVLVFIVQTQIVRSQTEKYSERFDQFELEAAKLDDGYQVFYYRQNMADERSIGGEEVFVEDLARIAVLDSGQRKRLDGAIKHTTSQESVVREHFLFDKGIWHRASGNTVNPTVIELKKDAPIGLSLTDANPIWLSFATALSFRKGRTAGYYDLFRNAKLVSEGKDEKGIYYAVLIFNNGRAGAKVEFADNPQWAPVRYTALTYSTEDSVDINKVTEKEILSWRVDGRTETAWEEIESKRWLPKQIAMTFSGIISGVKYESEVRFAGWKFGKDIDQQLIDPKLFTSSEIAKIDFEAWDREYFKPKKK